mmetsp:Transcript_35242/g.46408  ORF Transcript_35242/g.46408 Transcript_35242/m.46408 type:complete len:94 (+) Transcript_35242:33-314(+)
MQVNIDGLWTQQRLKVLLGRAYYLQARAFTKLYDLENSARFRQQSLEEKSKYEKTIDNLLIASELQPKNEEVRSGLTALTRAYKLYKEATSAH